MPTEDLLLRPALSSDLVGIAELIVASRRSGLGQLPPMAISEDDFRSAVARWPVDEPGTRGYGSDRETPGEVWVAVADDRPIGVARVRGAWLDDLYVAPDWQGRGVGSALIAVVKSRCRKGFGLWVFESNHRARAFYAHHGLLVLERTDGSGNEEREPDLRLEWSPDVHLDASP